MLILSNQLIIYLKKIYQNFNDFFIFEYNRLDLWYFVSFIFGIVLFLKYPIVNNLIFLIYILIFLVVLIFYFFAVIPIRFFLMIIICCIASYLWCFYKFSLIKVPKFKDGEVIEIYGEIDNIFILKNGLEAIIKINNCNPKVKLPKIKVKFIKNKNLFVGEKIKCKLKIVNLNKNRFFENANFNTINYMNKIYAKGYLVSKIEHLGIKKNLKYYIFKLHKNIYQRLINILGVRAGNLVAGFLLGEGRAIEQKLLKNLRNAGVSHLICISGLHLSLVSVIFFTFLRFILNISNYIAYNFNIKAIAALGALLFTYLYLLLSGCQIAASRAFILTFIYSIAILLMKKMSILRGLGIAVIILLINCPAQVFHPSFQMSFAAVLSLIAGFEMLKINKLKTFTILGRLKNYLISNIYSSFLAGFIIAPFVINNFRVLPLYSIISNMIAVPLMSFVLMPIALASVFLMIINLEKWPLKLLKIFIDFFIDFVEFISNLPYAICHFKNLNEKVMLFFLLGFFWMCVWQSKIRLLGVLVLIIMMLWIIFFY